MSEKEKNKKLDWKNDDKVFVPIYLAIVGIAGLIILSIRSLS